MNITTKTTRTITLTDEALGKIDLPIEPLDRDDIYVSAAGDRLAYLVDDNDCHDHEFPEGVEFVQGNSRYNHYENDVEGWLERVNADDNLTVFPVGVYEHGLIQYSLAGESLHSTDRWDYCIGACIAIPNDFTDPEQAARDILAEYTDWCNGSVYGIVTMEREESGDWDDGDACWGFIGYENAVENAKAEVA